MQIFFFVQGVISHVEKRQNVCLTLEKKGKKLYNKAKKKKQNPLETVFFQSRNCLILTFGKM